jgi:hypothetical protein
MLSGEFDSRRSQAVLAHQELGRNERMNTIAFGADSDTIVISLRNLWVEQLHITALYTQHKRWLDLLCRMDMSLLGPIIQISQQLAGVK